MDVLDFLDIFNVIDRAEGVIRGIIYGDIGREIVIDRREAWTGEDVEAILDRYGVAVYGRRITSERIIFRVKNRQARWAEHVLLRAGVPVLSGEIDKSNRGAFERHGGAMPPAWKDNQRRRRRRK